MTKKKKEKRFWSRAAKRLRRLAVSKNALASFFFFFFLLFHFCQSLLSTATQKFFIFICSKCLPAVSHGCICNFILLALSRNCVTGAARRDNTVGTGFSPSAQWKKLVFRPAILIGGENKLCDYFPSFKISKKKSHKARGSQFMADIAEPQTFGID